MPAKQAREMTIDLMRFIENSPTAAHAIAAAAARLERAGFTRFEEQSAWKLHPGDKFYVVRGYSSLVAGCLGSAPPAEGGFRIACAHTDAPGLRLKPNAQYDSNGYLQIGVEIYGDPLIATWTDRDLSLAGKLFVRQPKGPPRNVLVRSDRALCRIPQIAIHFNRQVNKDGLKLDKQRHLPPIFGLGDEEKLRAEPLLSLLAEKAGIDRNEIVAADLEVVDAQPPALGGIAEEFFFAPHIDNLAGSHAVLAALIQAQSTCAATGILALFDSEEVGSQTVGGARSLFLDSVLERICLTGKQPRESWHRALAQTMLVSVDGAHALHPNYADYHDPHHRPLLGGGPAIKISAQQRYATGAQSRYWFERCAARAEVPVQYYVHRTDLPCGTTIGPVTATHLGVPTVDVGNPMLSMHSIRETGGVEDQIYMIRALVEHFAD